MDLNMDVEVEYQRAKARLRELRALRDPSGQVGQNEPDAEARAKERSQLRRLIASHERKIRQAQGAIVNFRGLGELLIAVRKQHGISQRELAKRLGVHRSQVARDESTLYVGITVERAGRVLDALGAYVRTSLALSLGTGEVST